MSLMRASVTSLSPMRVRVDGAGSDGPAEPQANVTYAVGQRVVVEPLGSALIIVTAGATSGTPVGQTVYLKSPNGTVFKLVVSDTGGLSATSNL